MSLLIEKDESQQIFIPVVWRATFCSIVDALVRGDYSLLNSIAGVRPLSIDDANRIESNIKNYGCRLVNLPEDTWNTSVCQWMVGYWDVLVDLYTAEEGLSDLVLAVRVYEKNNSFEYEIHMVYVP